MPCKDAAEQCNYIPRELLSFDNAVNKVRKISLAVHGSKIVKASTDVQNSTSKNLVPVQFDLDSSSKGMHLTEIAMACWEDKRQRPSFA